MFTKTLKVPIFDAVVYIGIGKSVVEVVKHFKIDATLNSTMLAAVIPDEIYNEYYLCLSEDTLDIGTIVHEVNHIKNRILEFICFKPSYDNDEVDCYLLDYLVTKIWNIVTHR